MAFEQVLRHLIRESADIYHAKAKDFLSAHALNEFRRCPLLYRKKELGLVPERDTTAYLIGRAAHTLILEGRERYQREFAVGGPIQHVGGTWSGLALAMFACVLAGGLVGAPWSLRWGFVRFLAALTLVAGLSTLILHVIRQPPRFERPAAEFARVRHDMRDLEQDRRVAEHLAQGLSEVRTEADFIVSRPDVAGDFLIQLRRLLPEEGWLTQRLVEVREKAHHAKSSHAYRIDELREFMEKLPPAARAKAAEELAERYAELRLDVRLERLDRSVAEVERRVRELTEEAERCATNHEYRKVPDLLDEATRLQAHNAKLLTLIERTEQRLLTVARQVMEQTGGVSDV